MDVKPLGSLGLVNPLQGMNLQETKKQEGDFQKLLKEVEQNQDEEKLKEACQDMEAMFIHEMLKVMRASIPQGGLFPESMADKIYRDMLDEEYSKMMAKSPNSLGIGQILFDQLKIGLEEK